MIATPALVRAEAPPAATVARVAADLLALTKPRLAFFSVLSAMAAYTAAGAAAGTLHALLTLAGTSLAAAGALSLNQWWERDLDRLMRRTRSRPLPRAALAPATALAWSLALSVSGVAVLTLAATSAAAALAAATIVLSGLVYTPLKRRTRWATEVGAVAGALPPLLGGAAAGHPWAPAAWILFTVLLLWQMPHFYAIGWMHREDYRAAGFPLLPAVDPDGRRTAWWSLGYTAALLGASVAPWAFGLAGPAYGLTALATGAALAAGAIAFAAARPTRDAAARRLFLATILHLPVLMAALVLDRLT